MWQTWQKYKNSTNQTDPESGSNRYFHLLYTSVTLFSSHMVTEQQICSVRLSRMYPHIPYTYICNNDIGMRTFKSSDLQKWEDVSYNEGWGQV